MGVGPYIKPESIAQSIDSSSKKVYRYSPDPVLQRGDEVNVYGIKTRVLYATPEHVTVEGDNGHTRTFPLFQGIVDRLIF